MSPTAVAAFPDSFFTGEAAAGAAGEAALGTLPATASSSSTMRFEPTGITAPAAPPISTIVPVRGEVMVTVALSVMTSASG